MNKSPNFLDDLEKMKDPDVTEISHKIFYIDVEFTRYDLELLQKVIEGGDSLSDFQKHIVITLCASHIAIMEKQSTNINRNLLNR